MDRVRRIAGPPAGGEAIDEADDPALDLPEAGPAPDRDSDPRERRGRSPSLGTGPATGTRLWSDLLAGLAARAHGAAAWTPPHDASCKMVYKVVVQALDPTTGVVVVHADGELEGDGGCPPPPPAGVHLLRIPRQRSRG